MPPKELKAYKLLGFKGQWCFILPSNSFIAQIQPTAPNDPIWSPHHPSPAPHRNKNKNKSSTLPEANVAPENQWLEDEMSFWDGLFSVATLVLGSVVAG